MHTDFPLQGGLQSNIFISANEVCPGLHAGPMQLLSNLSSGNTTGFRWESKPIWQESSIML